jgi:hypothetical protein
MPHDIEWVTAPPLWDVAQADAGGRPRFRQPALLRFDSDSFMDELIALMESGAASLADRVAKPETWEKPAAGWVSASDASLAATLNLFQPVHGRFYVGAASLVCRKVGLPMRRVNAAEGERTAMLMRRLVPRASTPVDPTNAGTFVEQAWVGDRKTGVWTAVTASAIPVAGEERLPLFPLATSIEPKRTRQVWAGMLPVASREIYEGARPADAVPTPLQSGTTDDPLEELADPRRATFAARVMQAFVTLLESPPPQQLSPLVPTAAAVLAAAAPDMRESLTFALLDLADFLAAELPIVWNAVKNESSAGLGAPAKQVYDALVVTIPGTGTWREALRRADTRRPALLGTGAGTGPAPVSSSLTGAQIRTAVTNLIHGGIFQNQVFAALGAPPATPPPGVGGPPVLAARAAEGGQAEGALYWLRFVYERPVCAPFHDPVVSQPSRPFRLSGFFDPDAPARPLVIRMPLDTSPKGLRRFPKGVAVLMSNKLRQQIERVRNQKLKDLDDGKVGDEPSWGIGMICSLSIPIITLCAFIVLMIFLQLLNIVFWWMAFFKICLPIPVRNE